MDNIKFYIPDDEIIPTHLRLRIGDIRVQYEQIEMRPEITYSFIIYTKDTAKAESILNIIIGTMEYQSEDHGSSWRMTSKEMVENALFYVRFIVKFKVRDAM